MNRKIIHEPEAQANLRRSGCSHYVKRVSGYTCSVQHGFRTSRYVIYWDCGNCGKTWTEISDYPPVYNARVEAPGVYSLKPPRELYKTWYGFYKNSMKQFGIVPTPQSLGVERFDVAAIARRAFKSVFLSTFSECAWTDTERYAKFLKLKATRGLKR